MIGRIVSTPYRLSFRSDGCPFWEWAFWNAVGVLETRDEPSTARFSQHLKLNTIVRRLRDPRRCLRAFHLPSNMHDGSALVEKPNVHLRYRQLAVSENERKRTS